MNNVVPQYTNGLLNEEFCGKLKLTLKNGQVINDAWYNHGECSYKFNTEDESRWFIDTVNFNEIEKIESSQTKNSAELHLALFWKNLIIDQGDFSSPQECWIHNGNAIFQVPQEFVEYEVPETPHTGRIVLSKGHKLWGIWKFPSEGERGGVKITEDGTIESEKIRIYAENAYIVKKHGEIIGVVAWEVHAMREVPLLRKDRKPHRNPKIKYDHTRFFDPKTDPEPVGWSSGGDLRTKLCHEDEQVILFAGTEGKIVTYVKCDNP